MAYTAEMLAALSDRALDEVVDELVMGKPPEPGLLQRLKRSAVRQYTRLRGNGAEGAAFPTYSSSHAGMGLVIDTMLERGFSVAVAPGGVVWVAGAGREMKYVGGGSLATPRAVAIAATLAVQER
jgi:hypothetical protein